MHRIRNSWQKTVIICTTLTVAIEPNLVINYLVLSPYIERNWTNKLNETLAYIIKVRHTLFRIGCVPHSIHVRVHRLCGDWSIAGISIHLYFAVTIKRLHLLRTSVHIYLWAIVADAVAILFKFFFCHTQFIHLSPCFVVCSSHCVCISCSVLVFHLARSFTRHRQALISFRFVSVLR